MRAVPKHPFQRPFFHPRTKAVNMAVWAEMWFKWDSTCLSVTPLERLVCLFHVYLFSNLTSFDLNNDGLRGGFRPGSQGSGTLSAFSNLSNQRVRDLKNGKFIDFLGDWNAVTFLMTGFQNKTDSLSFFVSQLGCFPGLFHWFQGKH